MKILFLNNGKDFSNWGLKAATDGLVNILKDKIKNVEFLFLSHSKLHKIFVYEPSYKGFKLFTEHSPIAKKLFGEYIEIPKVADEFEFFANKWKEEKIKRRGSIIVNDLLKESDVVVFNAEGSTFRNNIAAIRSLFFLWYAKTKLNKKAFFLNGSVTLTSIDPILPAILKKTFKELDGISIREPISYQNVIDWFPELKEKVKMIPDSAFSINTASLNISHKIKQLDLEKDYFCFSTSMLPIDYKKTKKKSAIYSLLSKIKQKIPNLYLLGIDPQDLFLKSLANDLNANFIGPEYSYEDILYILSKAKFLLSGRYHHLIFAAKVGTPTIVLNTTSHKNIGLSKLFNGLMNDPFDPTNLWEEKEKILNYIDKILKNEEYFRDGLKQKANKYKNTVQEHAKIVLENIY